jgi:hypothetical protein
MVHARLYLPDPESGYYRGTRFDWSGIMPELNYKGHSFISQWFKKYNPTTNDAVMGPAESFSPLGYEEAAPGGSFVELGVGALTRTDSSAYSPFKYYKPLNTGKWKVKKSADCVLFTQKLDDTSYAYLYKKEVRLLKGKPELVLTHSLKNTGKRVIESDVYNHNFFVLDKLPMGPGLVIRFPFILSSSERDGTVGLSAIRGDSIEILRKPEGHESVYAVLSGYSGSAKDYDIRLENRSTGAGIRITCNRPLSKLAYWGSSSILCPEPYIKVKVLPGETFTWTIRYEFYSAGN